MRSEYRIVKYNGPNRTFRYSIESRTGEWWTFCHIGGAVFLTLRGAKRALRKHLRPKSPQPEDSVVWQEGDPL